MKLKTRTTCFARLLVSLAFARRINYLGFLQAFWLYLTKKMVLLLVRSGVIGPVMAF